ncbi:MAG TPA: alpha/beta fold hydrolase, partial [Woeseiaceae bacterium]|nr:alpha/beta fold hydrolase [Woeseiaceae bacterium]
MNKPVFAIVFLLLLTTTAWFLTPPRLEQLEPATVPTRPATKTVAGLVPDTESRIVWANGEARTPWAVVTLHGFSATRQETAPLAETVASLLNANLYEVRLTGHGLVEQPLAGVRAEDWLQDAADALVAGAAIGDKIVVIGTSTGATLAAAMLDHELAKHIDTLVMISPNFEPRDPGARWLTRPAGPLLARLAVGDTRCWEPRNELQARFWSTCYPTAAAVEMMRLVDRANRLLPADIPQRLLMFYSRNDKVISSQAALEVFDATASPQKAAFEITD